MANLEKERKKLADKDALSEIHTTLIELSNTFYEIIPNSLYIDRQPPVLVNISNETNCKREIDNLLNIEFVGKILLGAAYCDVNTNTLDYTYSSLGCTIYALKKNVPEYEMLIKWIENTSEREHKIHNILKYAEIQKFLHLRNLKTLIIGFGCSMDQNCIILL